MLYKIMMDKVTLVGLRAEQADLRQDRSVEPGKVNISRTTQRTQSRLFGQAGPVSCGRRHSSDPREKDHGGPLRSDKALITLPKRAKCQCSCSAAKVAVKLKTSPTGLG